MSIRSLIIDDEKLARSRLTRLLSNFKEIELIGEAANGQEALDHIRKLNPDLIFLDIRMPLLTGFELLDQLKNPPYIIFTTAYNEYALQAFEENTIDYLLKPIHEDKLSRAVEKARRILAGQPGFTPDLDTIIQSIRQKENRLERFSLKIGNRITLVHADNVLFFSAEEKYTFLNTETESAIIPFTLKELEDRLDPEMFIRVHRGTIANINRIESVQKWFKGKLKLKFAGGKEAEVSNTYLQEFKKKINL